VGFTASHGIADGERSEGVARAERGLTGRGASTHVAGPDPHEVQVCGKRAL
jgi:hypothetical protein